MRAFVRGEIVDLDRNEWNFNGKSGVTFSLAIRTEGASPASAADKIKVTPEQFGSFSVGEQVELPVVIFANTIERGGVVMGAKTSVSLLTEYQHNQPAHAGK